MDNLPKRKQMRMCSFDYSFNTSYFITVCAWNRACLFGKVMNGELYHAPKTALSDVGLLVEKAMLEIESVYEHVVLKQYVIMPNHIHMILHLGGDDGQAVSVPDLSQVIRQMKGVVTKKAGRCVWQKSFYDHVIRNDKDYERIAKYIADNPAKWAEDMYYQAD